jgi:hypothetical protein
LAIRSRSWPDGTWSPRKSPSTTVMRSVTEVPVSTCRATLAAAGS